GCRRVPGLDGAQALALGRVSGPRLLHARAPDDPGPGAVPVPVADPRAAAAAHAVLLRLAAALPGPAATVGHPAGAGRRRGPARPRPVAAQALAAVRPGRAVVLRRAVHHQQRGGA